MLERKHKIMTAMFDVKPVNNSGNIDVLKISSLQSVINLGRKFRISKNGGLISTIKHPVSKKNKTVNEKNTELPIEEFELFLNKQLDVKTELIAIGAEFHRETYSKPRFALISRNIKHSPAITKEEKNYDFALKQINEKISPVLENGFVGEPKKIDAFSLGLLTLKAPQEARSSTELEKWVGDFSKPTKMKVSKLNRIWFLTTVVGLISLIFFGHYGSTIRNQLIIEGNSAVANLENAGKNIKNMDFVSASNNFAQAYQKFSKAGDDLNFLGSSIGSLLSDLPGAGKLKSVKNLVEAGWLMANAGQAMSDAMGELTKINLILTPLDSSVDGAPGNDKSIGEISATLRKALTISQKNIGKAKQLLADVDDSSIPEDKKSNFEEFKSELPLFEKMINDSVDYFKFLEDFIGTKGIKKYLILFQNPSELRPTGGFPGTYGVVSFKDGKLQDFKVDDVYNLDGQLKELIIPPIQLQHITPNWGMRDANWFVDFPTSARTISKFFKKESGYDVDGVITFSPQIVVRILDIVGPIEMPEYNLILDSKNLLTALQEEVEYKGNRQQPKQIIMDLAPRMLGKLYSADSDQWLNIFNLLVSSMEQKDILMYFRDLNLQSFSVDKDFSGQVKNTDSDYLMVTFTNVKGSKTDLVIESSLKVQTINENGDIKHKVSITRQHNGGDSQYGFYNKQSPTYVRVLVPENAEFLGLKGNSRPDFKPLIDYTDSDFSKDDGLAKFEEESYTNQELGVTFYKEAGKTEFGFWMIINPGETKTVDLEYAVPASGENYQFYIQKQPSLNINDFKFYLDGEIYFDGRLDKDLIISPR